MRLLDSIVCALDLHPAAERANPFAVASARSEHVVMHDAHPGPKLVDHVSGRGVG
jgi:hypothetical protein